MRVAIYARVSTDDKDQDPERQIIVGRQYADLHDHVVALVVVEHHTGNSNPFNRPEFMKILSDNSIEGTIVVTIDRLSREHPNKLMNRLNQFKSINHKIISVREPIFNMESDFAEPMQYFLTWWNNQFLKKLSQDTKEGIERARRQGKQIGRAKVKFNQFRAYELLFVQKLSQRVVSKELGVSLATLNRFKKGVEKNPDLFIKESVVSERNV